MIILYSFIVEDCKWKWGEYSDCTAPCNGGTKTRYPIITQYPEHEGEDCPSHVKQNISESIETYLPGTLSCLLLPFLSLVMYYW